jgi:hypothetical protein
MEEACDRLHEQQRIAHDQPCRESEEAHEVGADPPLLRSERRTDVGRDRHVQTPATRTMPRVTRRSDQRLGPQLAEDAADLRGDVRDPREGAVVPPLPPGVRAEELGGVGRARRSGSWPSHRRSRAARRPAPTAIAAMTRWLLPSGVTPSHASFMACTAPRTG